MVLVKNRQCQEKCLKTSLRSTNTTLNLLQIDGRVTILFNISSVTRLGDILEYFRKLEYVLRQNNADKLSTVEFINVFKSIVI